MTYIPPIPPPLQTYSRFRRQGKRKVLNTENISDSKNQRTQPGHRRKGDRRKRHIKVLFNRRTIHSRRSKQFSHRSTTITESKKTLQKGANINTTA